jgi:hypothetical protein
MTKYNVSKVSVNCWVLCAGRKTSVAEEIDILDRFFGLCERGVQQVYILDSSIFEIPERTE